LEALERRDDPDILLRATYIPDTDEGAFLSDAAVRASDICWDDAFSLIDLPVNETAGNLSFGVASS
jgi:hypothetical protein